MIYGHVPLKVCQKLTRAHQRYIKALKRARLGPLEPRGALKRARAQALKRAQGGP